MSKAALLALADRVPALTGPCRETDAEIAVVALGWIVRLPRYEGDDVAYGYPDGDGAVFPGNGGGDRLVREFTASLDAAMKLAPEGWRIVSLGDRTLSFQVILSRGTAEFSRGEPVFGYAATPALALTAAALRAIAAEMPEGD
jgi:hypothetical protein